MGSSRETICPKVFGCTQGYCGLLDKLLKLFRKPEPIVSMEGLAEFLSGEASFLAQKSTIEYCRARSGVQWQKLFSEQAFLRSLERCRWEAFSLVLADVVLVAEGRLRPHASAEGTLILADALGRLYESILMSYPVPTHRSDWRDRVEELQGRLGRAQIAAPARTEEIAAASGRAVFDLLPIHPSLRGHDRLMIFNHIRFGLMTFAERFDRRVDAGALASRLRHAETGR
jgi:hypothetical protein